jgi:hypothetical protein
MCLEMLLPVFIVVVILEELVRLGMALLLIQHLASRLDGLRRWAKETLSLAESVYWEKDCSALAACGGSAYCQT